MEVENGPQSNDGLVPSSNYDDLNLQSMGFQLVVTINQDIEEIVEIKNPISQRVNFEEEAAIVYNISLLKQIPKEITNVKIFHTLQLI